MAPVFLRGVLHFFTAAKYLDDDVDRLNPERVQRARRTDSPILLETAGLSASYDGVRVLFGVDLEIRRGEIVALLGTNGAGKSTTLNAISGIVEPDGGNVWFDGEPITGETPERTAARGVVQVPGGRGVFPGLTVEDNLRMGSFMIRRDRALVSLRLDEVYELFPRLAERRQQRAGSLSGGERQMLTLAQSFLLHPKLLLIDELSLGLAPALVQELLGAVRRMNASGITILIVEQSVNLALTLAERAYFMEKGEVRFSGAATELLARTDLLRSVFLEGARTGLQTNDGA
jgi:branched-chain amino acid transport system ATP-binding protein